MTLPANIPNVPEWQLCRVRWTLRDFAGLPVDIEGPVLFSSSVPYVLAAGSKITLVSSFPDGVTFVGGKMTNVNGDSWVDLVASEDLDISPHGWTITVQVSIAPSAGRTRMPIAVTFTTPVNGDVDLSTVMPVQVSTGQAIVRGVGVASIGAVNTTATVIYTDGSSSTFALPVGPKGDVGPPGTDNRAALARTPDALIAGSVTRDANGAATSAPVVWPDSTPGTYTADTLSTAFPGAVDAYHITYGAPVTKNYTQPAVTRDANGAAITVPAIVVS